MNVGQGHLEGIITVCRKAGRVKDRPLSTGLLFLDGLNIDMMKQCVAQSLFIKVAHNCRPELYKT